MAQPPSSGVRLPGSEPRMVASVGITFAALPAWIAPNVRLTPSRGSDKRLSPSVRSSTTLDAMCTRSAVFCGRASMPAGALEVDRQLIGRRRDGARADAERTDIETGVAVQREDRRDVRHHSGLGQHACPARHRLLPRLQDQPHPSRFAGRAEMAGQRDRRADRRCGVHVVATRMTHARHLGSVRDRLRVGQAQRVDVCPDGHHGPALADVADDPDPGRRDLRLESGPGQLVEQRRRGPVLLPARLRVAVQLPAQERTSRIRARRLCGRPRRVRSVRSSTDLVGGKFRDQEVHHRLQVGGGWSMTSGAARRCRS